MSKLLRPEEYPDTTEELGSMGGKAYPNNIFYEGVKAGAKAQLAKVRDRPDEIKQEVINTLAMVENELCFGGNWEDAKARINRCRLVLDKAQLVKVRDRPDREELARTPIETHKYGGKRYLTLDGIDQISALFDGIRKAERERVMKGIRKLGYEGAFTVADWQALTEGK